MPSKTEYLTLSPDCFMKMLEEPCLYARGRDELYELDREAWDFLRSLRTIPLDMALRDRGDFVRYCLQEGLLMASFEPQSRELPSPELPPLPSLRYLMVHITDACNLQCRHCYLGDGLDQELDLEALRKVMEEFGKMQGLRLIVTGGEPLMHSQFWKLNELLTDQPFYRILLTNATLMGDKEAQALNFDEVQVSLDGMEEGHDFLRGKGSFKRAMAGIESLRKARKTLSIATMVHARMVEDFEELALLVKSIGAREWSLDVPALKGRMEAEPSLLLPWQEASTFVSQSFGGGPHSASHGDYACGTHLCAVMADGRVCKCGLMDKEPLGSIQEGLRQCWLRNRPMSLPQLQCQCPYLNQCRGGCRYRALKFSRSILGPDPLQCHLYGVKVY